MSNSPTVERLLPDDYDRDRVAIGFEWQRHLVDRMQNANWDVCHQDWDPDYEFGSERDDGAWIVDGTPESLAIVRERLPVTIPPIEEIPYASGEGLQRLPSGVVREQCRECGTKGAVVSESDALAIYSKSLPWVKLLTDNQQATHICSSCRTLFIHVVDEDEREPPDEEIDPTEAINSTPEQRAKYLAREHDLRDIEAEAIAYREDGFTASGIAQKLDVTEGTAKGYLRRAADRFGLEAIETKSLGERTGPLGQESK